MTLFPSLCYIHCQFINETHKFSKQDQDVAIRHSIRKSVTEQPKLFDSIGTAQMEQELQSKVLTITKKLSDKMEEETGVEASMMAEDMKE